MDDIINDVGVGYKGTKEAPLRIDARSDGVVLITSRACKDLPQGY